jgi:hypothetical protein
MGETAQMNAQKQVAATEEENINTPHGDAVLGPPE